MIYSLLYTVALLAMSVNGQLMGQMNVQVKITDLPFQVANTQHLNQVVWTMIGSNNKEPIYCVSEAPVSQLRFVCLDCEQRNITDMVHSLNMAQDLTRSAGFPTVKLSLEHVNTSWTGATIICQAALNGGTVDSAKSTIDVKFMNHPRVVDAYNQAPIVIEGQGMRFFVECTRGTDSQCQASGRKKTLKCKVEAHPPASSFKWLRNGVVYSTSGEELIIGTDMIGHSVQCSANNGLFKDTEMLTSQAVQIDPYSAAKVVQDNFSNLQSIPPFQAGNRIEINQQVNMQCTVEGSPRPVVVWRLRRSNGQVVDAACPQGYDGQYQPLPSALLNGIPSAVVRMNAICNLRISNYSYSGQYWCAACSFVSQGAPECSPTIETPGSSTLTIQVQGPPMASDAPTTIDQMPNSNNALLTVHYCAEPAPRPPREVIFSIDQNDIQVGQRWENFRFESQVQNNTVTNCFYARLQIAPVREEDQYRQISLKVQNQFGSKIIPVSLDSLLGGSSSMTGRISALWIVVLVLLGILLLLACLTAFCLRRKLLCFNKVKKEESPYNTTKAKSNLNVRATLYGDEPPPRLYQQSEVVTPNTSQTFPSLNDSGSAGGGGYQGSRGFAGQNLLVRGQPTAFHSPSPVLDGSSPNNEADYSVYLSREAVV